ncbi:MAG: beta strand repeat-containing protein [Phormidesmis sp.]
MARKQKQKTFRWQAYKTLVASAFAIAGVFNLVGAVVAAGTEAGTTITNTATATYDDGNGNNIDAVSNTVTINVAEVAGLTVVNSGFDDANGGSIVGNDVLTFDFDITNTGNEDTFVFVPGADNISVTNGTITSVDVIDATGTSIGTIPAATGASTDGLGTLPNGGLIGIDESFTVRVTVTAANLASPTGESVTVQFGNTTDNSTAPADGSQDQQNIRDDSDTAAPQLNDVRTLNNAADGLSPTNGEREAAASRSEAYNTAPIDLAQALLLKTSTYSDSSTSADVADDTIVYNLELRIGNDTSFPSVDPGNLEGTDIELDTTGTSTFSTVSRILVSDAIPANTDFDPGLTPTAPANWTAVYSTTPLTTNAQDAQWTTVQPGTASAITRVGFIYDSGANGSLAPLDVETGFSFRVVTNGLTAPGGSIANVAQVFGETEGDTDNNLVFDESGDQQPNNLDDGDIPTNNNTTFESGTDFGVGDTADPENTLNNNDGTGPNGESNVVTINALPPVAGALFNGPDTTPSATGPTNTGDDFTNVVIPGLTPGAPGTDVDAPSVTITNELNNPNATRLDTVTLLPLAPSVAQASVTGGGVFGADGDLPDGTLVTIAFGGQNATYEYTEANGFRTPGSTTAVPAPVVVGTLQASGTAGDTQDYTVSIDLPDGTGGTEIAQHVVGYGVPIIAFVDNNGNGTYEDATERATSNVTVDRVYTGFMRLVKEARVIYAERDGSTTAPTAFSTDLTTITDLTPGDTIQYRIRYDNISEEAPAAGGGNVILDAFNFEITENGSTGGNTWGAETVHTVTAADVGGSPNPASTSATSGIITYTVGGASTTTEPTAGTADVDIYVNTVGRVEPQDAEGSFVFSRQVE